MTAELSVEATGETVGEAKWAALRELEGKIPHLDRDTVKFQVVSEGERGLLGVGYSPARVVASAPAPPKGETHSLDPPPSSADAAVVQELIDRTIGALDLAAHARLQEHDDTIEVTLTGPDVGVLIGRHGQTLDALQHLATSVSRRTGDDGRRVVVDAAGYRERRETAVTASARQAAMRAAATGSRVALEPMGSVERRIVHEALKDDPEVSTASEGSEPHRYVVVIPGRSAD